MATQDAPRDNNFVPAALFEKDGIPGEVMPGQIDETTGRILVDSASAGGGTVTSVSVTTANGVSGSVATATTTPAITLTLGAITPTSVTPSGLTASELVSTNASKTLTSLAVATYPSLTEISYVKGVSSAIQTQLNAKGVGNVTKVGTPVDNQVGVWTGDGTIEGDTALTFDTATDTLTTGILNSTALTASELVATDASKNLQSLAVATYPSLTELSYVKGVTSAIQTQLNGKAATLAGTINEITYFNSSSTIASLAVATYPSLTELSYVKGVTSAIQTQIGTKAPSTAPTFATSVTGSYLTASEMLITDGSKNIVSAPVATYPSLTELSYVKGLSSAVQTQIGTKAPSANPTFTGSVSISEDTPIKLDRAALADGQYVGTTIEGTAGAALAFGDIIYLAVADSRWELADATAAATGVGMIGICVLAAAGDASATRILLHGFINAATVFPALTVGAPVYLDDVAGDVSVAIPTGADTVIRVLGFAMTADEMYWNPSQDVQITVA